MRNGRHEETSTQAELAALADGSLSPERRAALEARVAESSELADLLAEQERAVTLTRSAAAQVEAPAGLRRRVEAQRHHRGLPAPRLVLAGAAAVLVVAVGIGIGLDVLGSGSSTQLEAALSPTALAPNATGNATLTNTPSGWQIELYAPGLPTLSGGRFYEAWLRNRAGVFVPVGTFNDGSRRVVLWAGVSPKDFRTLVVTRERAGGNPGSSGQNVLVGTVRASG
jgi:hypothetical protein